MSKRVEPIKNKEDIKAMKEAMIEDEDWRAYLMFTVGINFGLRISDLLSLKFNDLIDKEGDFREVFTIDESKTNKRKNIKINQSVKDAINMVIENTFLKRMENYNRPMVWSGNNSRESMSRTTAHRIMKKYSKKVEIEDNISTHSLRKTHAFHIYKKTGDLALVQKILNHSSPEMSLRYLGINSKQMNEAVNNLNL